MRYRFSRACKEDFDDDVEVWLWEQLMFELVEKKLWPAENPQFRVRKDHYVCTLEVRAAPDFGACHICRGIQDMEGASIEDICAHLQITRKLYFAHRTEMRKEQAS